MTASSSEFDQTGYFGELIKTPSRRGLHGRIVGILGSRIVSGDLAPGTLIEPDRLVAELRVSRTVVREVIKVLTAKGLLDARPKRGTYVLPRRRWNLLDADVMTWRNSDAPDARLLVELEEVRQIIEPWGARLAAQRRTPAHIVALDEAFRALEATADDRSVRGSDADVRFHAAILAAAQNELLERLESLLEPALRARLALAHEDDVHDIAFVDSHREVLECIRDGRAEEAFTAMGDLLRAAAADTDHSLRRGAPGAHGSKTRGDVGRRKPGRPPKATPA